MIAGALEVQLFADVARIKGDMEKATGIIGGAMKQIESMVGNVKTALYGLAAGFTIAAIANFVKGTIEAAERLHDLALQAGMTVEGLSGLAAIGKYSSRSAEDIANSAAKLAKNLSGATEESKGAGKALDKLGIDFDTFKKMKADEQFMAIAKAMEKYTDGQGKSAIAQALWGKEGAKNLPMLKDLAAAGTLVAKVTSEQAEMADHLSDNLLRVRTSGDAWKKQIAMAMLPALDQVVQAFLDVTNGTGGIKQSIAELARDGTITRWTTMVINGVTYVIDAFQGAGVAVKTVAMYIGASLASSVAFFTAFGEAYTRAINLDFSGAINSVRNGAAQQKSIWGDLATDVDKLWGEKTFGAKIRDRMADLGGLGTVAKKAGEELDFTNINEKNKKGAENAYASILKGVNEHIAAAKGERDAQRNLTEEEKFAIKVIADMDNAKKALSPAQKAAIVDLLKESKALADANTARERKVKLMQLEYAEEMRNEEERNASLVADSKEREKVAIAITEQYKALEDSRAMMQAEGETLGMTAQKRQAYIDKLQIQLKLQRDLDALNANLAFEPAQRAIEAARMRDLAEEQKRTVDQKAALQESIDLIGTLEATAHDTWTNVQTQGESAFKRIGQSLKAWVWDLLYQMTLKKWLISIGASVTGATADAATSAGGSAVGSSLFGGAASAAGGGLISGMATAYTAGSTSVGVMAGSVAGGGGVMGGVASALGAIPVYGWIALAAIALFSMFGGKGGGPKNIGSFSSDNALYDGARDDANAAANDAAKTSVSGILGAYSTAAQQLGLTAGKLDAAVMTSVDDKGDGDAQTALAVQAYLNGQLVYDRENALSGSDAYKDVGRTPEELQAAMQLAASRAVALALQKTVEGGAGQVAKFFAELRPLEMSSEQITAAITLAANAQSMYTAFQRLGPAFSAASTLTVQGMGALIEKMGGLEAAQSTLANYFDAYYSAEEKRQAVVRNIVEALGKADITLTAEQVAGASRAQLRALEEFYAQAGDADKAAAVMSVAAAFASITPEIDALAPALQRLGGVLQSTRDQMQNDVDKAAAALREAQQQQLTDMKSAADRFRGWADDLRKFRDSLLLGELSPLTPGQKYAEAARQFNETYAAAMGGDADAVARLQAVSTAFLSASQTYNASSDAYLADFAKVQTALTLGASRADAAATAADAQVAILQAQLAAQGDTNTNLLSISQLLANLSQAIAAALSVGLNPGASNVAALTGGVTGSFVQTSVGAVYASAGGAAAVGSQIYDIQGRSYTVDQARAYLQSLADAGQGLDAYYAIKSAGMTLADADKIMGYSPNTIEGWARAAGLPVFHQGTPWVQRTGLALLEAGEAVIPRSQNTAGGDTGALVQRLIERVETLTEQHAHGVSATVAAQYDAASKAADKMVDGTVNASGRERFARLNRSEATANV